MPGPDEGLVLGQRRGGEGRQSESEQTESDDRAPKLHGGTSGSGDERHECLHYMQDGMAQTSLR